MYDSQWRFRVSRGAPCILFDRESLILKINFNLQQKHGMDLITVKYPRFSHDVVTCDVDRDDSTAYC